MLALGSPLRRISQVNGGWEPRLRVCGAALASATGESWMRPSDILALALAVLASALVATTPTVRGAPIVVWAANQEGGNEFFRQIDAANGAVLQSVNLGPFGLRASGA